jgi:hypothetical protein
MRSPIGPILIVLGLGTTLVLALLLVQTSGMRDEVAQARSELSSLQADVAARGDSVTADELTTALDALEERIEALGSTGGAGTNPDQPAGGDGSGELLDRLDEVLERINDLDQRVDEICDSVPVC